jgi:hypothetical protein
MTEAHDFFSYESPAEKFCDVKNYFRDGLRVNHDERMGYRLSLQPLPVGALRTYSKAKIHPFGEDTNHTHFIQTLVFPMCPNGVWRLCVFAVEVLFQLRFLG